MGRQRSPVPVTTVWSGFFPWQNEGEGCPSCTALKNSCWGNKGRLAGRGAKLPCGNPFLITTPLRCSPVVSCGFSCDRLEGFLTAESLSDQRWRYSWYCVFLSHCGGDCCKHCCESCQSPGSGETTAEVHVPASGAVGGGLKQVSLTLESDSQRCRFPDSEFSLLK